MSMIRTYADARALAEAAATHVVECARKAIADRGRFALALSGGSTPRLLYERLASRDFADRIDWPQVHVFWGDERAVPPDHADSNYRMARETLLAQVPIPQKNIHPINGEAAPTTAAAEYEALLRQFFMTGRKPPDAPGRARFDLVLLGMGEDGHTASLFPGAPVITEGRQWVAAYRVEKLDAWRITLTPAVLNAALEVVFLVSGAEKARRLQQVLYGPYQPRVLPAQIVRPERGRVLWMVDDAATGRSG